MVECSFSMKDVAKGLEFDVRGMKMKQQTWWTDTARLPRSHLVDATVLDSRVPDPNTTRARSLTFVAVLSRTWPLSPNRTWYTLGK
jgi:hypothetical protein